MTLRYLSLSQNPLPVERISQVFVERGFMRKFEQLLIFDHLARAPYQRRGTWKMVRGYRILLVQAGFIYKLSFPFLENAGAFRMSSDLCRTCATNLGTADRSSRVSAPPVRRILLEVFPPGLRSVAMDLGESFSVGMRSHLD